MPRLAPGRPLAPQRRALRRRATAPRPAARVRLVDGAPARLEGQHRREDGGGRARRRCRRLSKSSERKKERKREERRNSMNQLGRMAPTEQVSAAAPICRICLEHDEPAALCRPCACKCAARQTRPPSFPSLPVPESHERLRHTSSVASQGDAGARPRPLPPPVAGVFHVAHPPLHLPRLQERIPHAMAAELSVVAVVGSGGEGGGGDGGGGRNRALADATSHRMGDRNPRLRLASLPGKAPTRTPHSRAL